MKRYFSWLTALFLISGISLAGAAPSAVPDLVHVDADLTSDHKDPKSGPEEIIDYKLKLLLTNHLAEPTGPLVVRITFHNRDLAKRANGVEKVLTLDAAIKGRGTQEVTSAPVTYTFTPEHGQSIKAKRGKVRSKRVPASGKRYAGYSVQILQGGKVIGEKVSSDRFRPGSDD
jgi:hypothetical protein